MATKETTTIEPKKPAELMVLDEQGFPLIPHIKLPFVDPTKDWCCGVRWGPVPKNYFEAVRYGRDMALALLRVAPQGSRTRVDDIQALACCWLLEMQIEGRPKKNSNDSTAIYMFWKTLLHFIGEPPTHHNVQRYLLKDELGLKDDEIVVLRNQVTRLSSKRRRSGTTRRKKAA
jgi:hypothetical protein